MEQAKSAQRDHSQAYTVVREYQLSPAGAPQPSSEVVAEVNFVPPSQKDYEIIKSEGSDRGESVVRKILDHETRMASNARPHQVDTENYNFTLLGRETLNGRDCYVLQLIPKREAVELVNGKAWVDAHDFMVRRIEGTTAESPSIWVKKLSIAIDYGEVNGVWVETSERALAEVRLVGPHVLTSRELEVRPATVDAQARNRKRRNNNSEVADTAAWMAR